MSVKIQVRVAGASSFQDLELPEGMEIRDVVVESKGMRVAIEPQDIGWRSGKVHTSLRLNELDSAYNAPDVGLTVGETDAAETDPSWLWRTDAQLYSAGKKIVAKNVTLHAGYKEVTISAKPWKNPYVKK